MDVFLQIAPNGASYDTKIGCIQFLWAEAMRGPFKHFLVFYNHFIVLLKDITMIDRMDRMLFFLLSFSFYWRVMSSVFSTSIIPEWIFLDECGDEEEKFDAFFHNRQHFYLCLLNFHGKKRKRILAILETNSYTLYCLTSYVCPCHIDNCSWEPCCIPRSHLHLYVLLALLN